MHNKKLKGGIAVLALSAVLVGGTFAWLGSTDSLVNKFTSAQPTPVEDGVEIWEVFDTTNAGKAEAGTAVNKDVQVQNTANYNSLIRVNFAKAFVDGTGGVVNSTLLDANNIELDVNKANVITLAQLNSAMASVKDSDKELPTTLQHKWVEVEQTIDEKTDTYYYYLGNVKPGGFTNPVLDSVTLSANVANNAMYMNRAYDVTVNAYSIQSTAEAVTDLGNGQEEFGAYGDKDGFGLKGDTYSELARALEIVAKGAAETKDQLPGSTN